jgi:zinc transport system ATP-binding protein
MGSIAVDERILISVENVSFGYGFDPVLVDINLRIERGDFLAIIGPNGSGKTTLIKIILGLLSPTQGQVRLMGCDMAGFKDWEKIGYIPQKATHFDPLFPASVREAIAMALQPSTRWPFRLKPEETAAIDRALATVGLAAFAPRRIGRLSGGQQQRVFIARALVHRPLLLVLDEPTTGVDAETQDRFYDLLDRLNAREGLTIVLITHDIGIVDRHVTKVACLNQRLVFHGTHQEFCRSDTLKNMLAGGHHLISHQH